MKIFKKNRPHISFDGCDDFDSGDFRAIHEITKCYLPRENGKYGKWNGKHTQRAHHQHEFRLY